MIRFISEVMDSIISFVIQHDNETSYFLKEVAEREQIYVLLRCFHKFRIIFLLIFFSLTFCIAQGLDLHTEDKGYANILMLEFCLKVLSIWHKSNLTFYLNCYKYECTNKCFTKLNIAYLIDYLVN